ncbi:MAG: hypothetical protein HGN29_14415 [Asgard group archaeon]|nr:hypothetical protein [Asgard group archaeon]
MRCIWINEVIPKCPDIPIIICGNKYDLTEASSIDRDNVLGYVRLRRFGYIETSALNSYNVLQTLLSC